MADATIYVVSVHSHQTGIEQHTTYTYIQQLIKIVLERYNMSPFKQPVKVVAACGLARHGKDTFSDVAVSQGFVKVSFAAALKSACAAAFGLPVEHFHDASLKAAPFPGYPDETYRTVMQKVGTDLFRNAYPGIWIKAAQNTMQNIMNRQDNFAGFVISDMRFGDELAFVRSIPGSIVVRVIRPGYSTLEDAHPSETESSKFSVDVTMLNDRTLAAFREDAEFVLNRYVMQQNLSKHVIGPIIGAGYL
jgi:hypothetical protein